MHEYAIVRALMDKVEENARGHDRAVVHDLYVRIGERSGVVAELLDKAFEMFREGTLCSSAKLHIEHVPAAWVCHPCAKEVSTPGILRCAECGAPLSLERGDEIILDRIELEVPDV